jgi:hypothetical protein
MDFFGVFLDLLFHCLESAVAGHARDQQLTIGLFGDGKISGGQLDGQLFIRAMSRARTATGPILQLMKSNIEELRYASDRIIVLSGRSMKGASRVIRNLFHRASSFSNPLKIS